MGHFRGSCSVLLDITDPSFVLSRAEGYRRIEVELCILRHPLSHVCITDGSSRASYRSQSNQDYSGRSSSHGTIAGCDAAGKLWMVAYPSRTYTYQIIILNSNGILFSRRCILTSELFNCFCAHVTKPCVSSWVLSILLEGYQSSYWFCSQTRVISHNRSRSLECPELSMWLCLGLLQMVQFPFWNSHERSWTGRRKEDLRLQADFVLHKVNQIKPCQGSSLNGLRGCPLVSILSSHGGGFEKDTSITNLSTQQRQPAQVSVCKEHLSVWCLKCFKTTGLPQKENELAREWLC